jgi:hypothetical protein
MLASSKAQALDTVLCVNAKGNGAPKFRAAKPPAPAACKSTEIQLAHFDGTTFQFTGLNVQIVSGAGKTAGAVNGKGNLIVGYNETGLCSGQSGAPCNTDADCNPGNTCFQEGPSKAGSHNIVVGGPNAYPSYGGLVAGLGNTISGPFSSVTGGAANNASGPWSSISGGGGLTQPVDDGWAAGSRSSLNTVVGDFESP